MGTTERSADPRSLHELQRQLSAAREETRVALEREVAVSEILRAISASPTDVQPVLDAIVTNALRFCGAEDAAVMLPDGDHLQLAAHRGPVPAARGLRYPIDGTSVSSHAFLAARTIAVQDLQTATDYPVAAEHARSVWVESETGKGSTFHFTIPPTPAAVP